MCWQDLPSDPPPRSFHTTVSRPLPPSSFSPVTSPCPTNTQTVGVREEPGTEAQGKQPPAQPTSSCPRWELARGLTQTTGWKCIQSAGVPLRASTAPGATLPLDAAATHHGGCGRVRILGCLFCFMASGGSELQPAFCQPQPAFCPALTNKPWASLCPGGKLTQLMGGALRCEAPPVLAVGQLSPVWGEPACCSTVSPLALL